MPVFGLDQQCRSFVLFDHHCQHQDHKYAATNTVIASTDNAHLGLRAGVSGTCAGVSELYGVTEEFHVGLVLTGLSFPPVFRFV